MGIPRFFKIPTYKKFEYRPLYWDQEKEELNERIREIEAEMGVKHESFKPGVTRGKMRGYISKTRKQNKQSNLRLVIILAFLFALAYIFLYHNPS